MLKITTEGRKAALDLRLVLPGVRESPDSKVNLAVQTIHQVWLDTAEQRGRAARLLRYVHATGWRTGLLRL